MKQISAASRPAGALPTDDDPVSAQRHSAPQCARDDVALRNAGRPFGPRYPGGIKLAYVRSDGEGGQQLVVTLADGSQAWWPLDPRRTAQLAAPLVSALRDHLAPSTIGRDRP